MLKNLWLALKVSWIAVFACGGNGAPGVRDESAPSFDRQPLLDLMAEHDIPGLAVAVSHRGRDHFVCFGVTDRETGTPVTRRTLFEVGSVSKLFTATLATLAEQEGVLSLDAPIGTYLQELDGTPLGSVPVFHLATHTAGGFPLQLPAHVNTEASLVEYFRSWEPESAAGRQRHYANPSIGLLGVLVARARNTGFRELMEADLFAEIGMSGTYIRVPDEALGAYAWGHSRKGERVRVTPALLADEAYGVKTTSADLLAFLKLNLECEKLASPLARAVGATQESRFDTGVFEQALIWEKYGYPLDLDTLRSGNSHRMILEPAPVVAVDPSDAGRPAFVLSKTGSTGGFGAYVLAIPSEDLAIVLLANKNYPNAARIDAAYRIVTDLLPPAP